MPRTCRVCGKPELRQHRHDPAHAMKVRDGRLVAAQYRRWVRGLVAAARERLEAGA